MQELIDRNALGVGFADPCVFESPAYANGWNNLMKLLMDAPVIDTPVIDAGPKWISVKDRLPEPPINPDGYLCRYIFSDLEKPVSHYLVLSYLFFEEKPHFQHEGSRGLHVTHWMPLPRPPKEDK